MVEAKRKGGARTDPAQQVKTASKQPSAFSPEAAWAANSGPDYSLGENKHDARPQQQPADHFAEFAAACLYEPSRSDAKGQRYICGPLDVDTKNAKGNWRIAEAALPRRWLALDIDGCPPEEWLALRTWAKQWRHFRYTTASDTPESRRVRFVFELADEVDRAQGIAQGEWLTAEVATVAPGAKVDPSVFRAEQPVFLPLFGAKSFRRLKAPPMPVQAGTSKPGDASAADDAPLMSMNAAPLPNMTPKQALQVLKALPAHWGAEGEGTWYRVAGAVHIQFDGSEEGYAVLDEWSRERGDYNAESNRTRWEAGFSHQRGKQAVTSMRNLVFEARDGGATFKPATLAAWGLAGSTSDVTDTSKGRVRTRETVTGAEYMANHRKINHGDAIGMICPVGVVMLAGMGGLGKSTLCATLAAHVTNGKPCVPWEVAKPSKPRAPAGVLWLTVEEDLQEIVLPRHEEIGGDLSLIRVPKVQPTEWDADGAPIASDFDIEVDLRPMLLDSQSKGAPIRFVVCDTLTALVNWHRGKRSANSDADVKQMMGRLKAIADEFGCCILGTGHLNKKVGEDIETRVTGAGAWRDYPRLAFMCEAPNNDGGGTCFLYMIKGNDFDGYYGVSYEQREVRLLRSVEAETEDGEQPRQALRRVEFTSKLLRKAVVLDRLNLARQGMADERNESKTDRHEAMAAIVREVFDVLDADELPASMVWREVAKGYNREPNSTEKKRVCILAGIEGARGRQTLWRVR